MKKQKVKTKIHTYDRKIKKEESIESNEINKCEK